MPRACGQEQRCGKCVHFNGRDLINVLGDCPFFAEPVSNQFVCERFFPMDQLRAAAYGKKSKQPELFE